VLRAEAAGLADVLGAAGAEAAAASAARATLGAQLAQALQRLAQVCWSARRHARGQSTRPYAGMSGLHACTGCWRSCAPCAGTMVLAPR